MGKLTKIEIHYEDYYFHKPSTIFSMTPHFSHGEWCGIQALIKFHLKDEDLVELDKTFDEYLCFFVHSYIEKAVCETLCIESENFYNLLNYQCIILGEMDDLPLDYLDEIEGVTKQYSEHGDYWDITNRESLEEYLYCKIKDAVTCYRGGFNDFMNSDEFNSLNVPKHAFLYSLAASLYCETVSDEFSHNNKYARLIELIYFATEIKTKSDIVAYYKNKISMDRRNAAAKRHAPQAKLKEWVQQKYLQEKDNYKSANNWAKVNTGAIQEYARENNLRPSYSDRPELTFGRWCREVEK